MTKAEQLSGANYTDIPQLKEQLLLDLINRWIYCDEDRNPNNYMIRYTSRGDQVVIAIDFSNVDLLFPGTKIKGIPETFGWERMEKTRYLTPLKREHFQGYDMELFGMRFDAFAGWADKMLMDLCKRCLRFQPDHAAQAKVITENVLKRIEYVRDYFSRMFPKVARRSGAGEIQRHGEHVHPDLQGAMSGGGGRTVTREEPAAEPTAAYPYVCSGGRPKVGDLAFSRITSVMDCLRLLV